MTEPGPVSRMARCRADELLVARGLCDSTAQASRHILAGEVVVDSPQVTGPLKPGTMLPLDAQIRFGAHVRRGRYVSRGGEKLEGALRAFGYDPSGERGLDAGASTGGFTDCLLQHGAAHVVAVDVGYGQLAWSLREDPRVAVLERTNVRDLTPDLIGGAVDLAVADLSFISLRKVAPAIVDCLRVGGAFIALVKPQFEAESGDVGDRGVVGSAAVHRQVLLGAASDLASCGLEVVDLAFSPIRGPEGNIEFWIESVKSGANGLTDSALEARVSQVVDRAHRTLAADPEPEG